MHPLTPTSHSCSSFDYDMSLEAGPSVRPPDDSSLLPLEPRNPIQRPAVFLGDMIHSLAISEGRAREVLESIQFLPATRNLCILDLRLNNFLHHTENVRKTTDSILENLVRNMKFLQAQAEVLQKRLKDISVLVSEVDLLSKRIKKHENVELSPEDWTKAWERIICYIEGLKDKCAQYEPELLRLKLESALNPEGQEKLVWEKIDLSQLHADLAEFQKNEKDKRIKNISNITLGGTVGASIPLALLKIGQIGSTFGLVVTFCGGFLLGALIVIAEPIIKSGEMPDQILPSVPEYDEVLRHFQTFIDDLENKKKSLEEFLVYDASFFEAINNYVNAELVAFREKSPSKENWDQRVAIWEKVQSACAERFNIRQQYLREERNHFNQT